MEEAKNQIKSQRVVTFLNRDEVDFLDKMGKDALFSSGTKLSRAKLIAWLIDILKGLNISGENLRTEKDLEDKIMAVIKEIENSNQPR
jgi:hypothetical protein